MVSNMIDIRANVIAFLNDKFKDKQYRQIDLANYLGITKTNVSHWLSDANCPDVRLFPKIAEFFNVSVIELMGLNDLVDISFKERQMLESYRNSSDEVKAIIDKILEVK